MESWPATGPSAAAGSRPFPSRRRFARANSTARPAALPVQASAPDPPPSGGGWPLGSIGHRRRTGDEGETHEPDCPGPGHGRRVLQRRCPKWPMPEPNARIQCVNVWYRPMGRTGNTAAITAGRRGTRSSCAAIASTCPAADPSDAAAGYPKRQGIPSVGSTVDLVRGL